MRVEINGIKKNVPDVDVQRIMQGLQVSQAEAIQIWMEDEGILVNNEQEQLEQKAKDSGVMRTIHGAISQKVVDKRMNDTPTAKKTVKDNPDKRQIITDIAELLTNMGANVNIENPTKVVTFIYKNNPYKIDLTATRKKKES